MRRRGQPEDATCTQCRKGETMRTLALATALLGAILPAMPQAAQDGFRPFSATLKAQYWTETGKYAERHTTFARSADGSHAFISDEAAPGDPDQTPRAFFSYRLNVSKRWRIVTESFTMTAVVTYIPDDRELKALASSYGTCDNLSNGTRTQLARSTMFGLEVVETEIERDERSLIKEWVAPSLQCFALKRTEVLDGRLRVNIEAVSVELREPDPVMFQPPVGHELVSPLMQEQRYKARFPGHELFGQAVYKLEQQYQSGLAASKQRQSK